MDILEELHRLEYTHPNIDIVRNLFERYIVGIELKYRSFIKNPDLINILNTLADERISEKILEILNQANLEKSSRDNSFNITDIFERKIDKSPNQTFLIESLNLRIKERKSYSFKRYLSKFFKGIYRI